ncbi:MAG: hypothetical protein ACRDDZ_01345 [Marinifilaceae bacterium]
MLIYKNPQLVNSPKGHIEVVEIIYDGGIDPGYSIAIVKWDGNPAIAMRWNISQNESNDIQKINGKAECIGNPQSRGVATWFVLPQDEEYINLLQKALIRLNEIKVKG